MEKGSQNAGGFDHSSPFIPIYAVFLCFVTKHKRIGRYVVAGVQSTPETKIIEDTGKLTNEEGKTNKITKVYDNGYPGGKEAKVDKGNIIWTVLREFWQEIRGTKRKKDRFIKILEKTRKNNEKEGAIFTNHYFYILRKDDSEFSIRISTNDSVILGAWYTLSAFDRLMLKPWHRIAHVELCYVLEDYAKSNNDQLMIEDLKDCTYQYFERPSLFKSCLMWKCEDGDSLPYKEKAKELLGKDMYENLFDGFEFTDNPQEVKK